MSDRPGTGGEQHTTYVYCIGHAQAFRNGSLPFATPGIGGRGDPVRTVEFADLAAVVSTSPATRYDISRENLLAHQRVLEEAMARGDVLPVSFGTVAHSDEEVRDKLLKRELEQLHRSLEYIRGRVELELRVLWNRERLFSEIVEEDPQVRALRDRLARRPKDSAYYERIELGRLTEAAIQRKSDWAGATIMEALEPLAVATRAHPLTSDMLVLNAAFLVEKAREEAFDARVQALGAEHDGRLVFRYMGPLPPYNFVDVSVRWDDEPGEAG